eukprot:scaffold21772_cov125-Skeletonema_dohrnii-CCMP3373.AAC.3
MHPSSAVVMYVVDHSYESRNAPPQDDMQYTIDAKENWTCITAVHCRAGRDKGSFKSTNDKTHDNNNHATNNFDDSTTRIAQFMLDDRDVTLQWCCDEAGGRQTIYYERGATDRIAHLGMIRAKPCFDALIQGAVCLNAP